MQAYIAYGAEGLGRRVADALCAAGIDNFLETEAIVSELDATDMLILAVENVDQLDRLRPVWQYYLDALDWKRRETGTVAVVCPVPLKSAYVPFRLKRCPFFTDVNELTGLARSQPREPVGQRPTIDRKVEAPAQFRYAAHVEAPALPQKEKRPSSACKEDHVFEDTPWWNNEDAQKRHAKSSKPRGAAGCLIAAIVVGLGLTFAIINLLRLLPF